jgi:glycosyltransferase involved in cell wall biosynthesis
MPAVSVIATVLNESENIARLIESLTQQALLPAEIIVVDGGSSDGTWEQLQRSAAEHPMLRPIRDESCNLKHTAGPISKGRNVAIAAAKSELIACADAGCGYAPDWLGNLIEPLTKLTTNGEAEYALGGACLDLTDATIWDWASAPFLGVKLDEAAPTKSCTARSMAFTKDLWRRLGGFPETVFFGEDTLFDLEARRVARTAFPPQAKAHYRPRNSFLSACRQLARYAVSDGVLGERRSRLARNATRCVIEMAALAALPWTWIPAAAVGAMMLHFAFESDGRFLLRMQPGAAPARLAFSIFVPWIIAINQVRGKMTKRCLVNPQNEGPQNDGA